MNAIDYNDMVDANATQLLEGKGPHVTKVPLQTISRLAPFSALILSIICINYFLVRFYVLEGFLMKKVYGKIYTSMDEITRKGFVNHHIAGGTKLLILIIAAYPFIDVAFVNSTFHTPFAGSKYVTQGDILIIVSQMLIGMYIFELFYRTKISPVSVGHHIGTILIGETAIAISLDLLREKDATIEFILCTIWGAFDIVSEFLPHVSIILYRVYPNSHRFLKTLFKTAMVTTLTGTTAETILTMYLFGSLWDRWTMAFKITTPMLHLLFMSCQLWGSYNFYKMYKRQQRIIEKKEGKTGDVEQQLQQDHVEPIELQEEPKGTAHATITVDGSSLQPLSRDPSREPSRDGSQVGLLPPSRR